MVLYIHHRISAGQGAYTSFCDVSEELSCDVVLASSYASVLGIPVAGWALLSYVIVGALAFSLRGARGEARLRSAATLLAFTVAMLAISAYFFVISTFVIGVACPLCLSLDAVNLGLFAVAFAIVRLLRATAPPGWSAWLFWLPAAGLTAAAVVALALLQTPRSAATTDVSIDDIRDRDPRFYAWYISQPIVDPPLDGVSPSPEGAITVIEFSDFECPHCSRAYADLHQALVGGEEDVRLVHRNFPLNSDCNPQIDSQAHAHACQAAVASECAAAQGRGDEYNRLLFQNQGSLDTPSLVGYAARLGLDQTEFERCLASPAAAAKVAADVAAGVAAGVKSTPTFFIAGRRVAGGLPRPEHYRYAIAIERARAADGSPPPDGSP